MKSIFNRFLFIALFSSLLLENTLLNAADWFEVETNYRTISLSRTPTETLGSLINAQPSFRKIILRDCLAYELGKAKNGVIPSVTPQKILQFFREQELVPQVKKPTPTENGATSTFEGLYGVEHQNHGLVEEKAITLIKELLKEGDVTFLDLGAGYGLFAKKVLEACKEDLSRLSILVNECLSAQCYHIAELFLEHPEVKIYPRDILDGLDYGKIENTLTLSTIFNVHHFMTPFRFKRSLEHIFRITEPGGYHIAIAMSPYHLGEDSLIAKEYARRSTTKNVYGEHPGYFIEKDISDMGLPLLSVRAPLLLFSQEVYETAFEEAGFIVVESGYFSSSADCCRGFTYVIGKKTLR